MCRSLDVPFFKTFHYIKVLNKGTLSGYKCLKKALREHLVLARGAISGEKVELREELGRGQGTLGFSALPVSVLLEFYR